MGALTGKSRYDYSLEGEEWCRGCVFEFRFDACPHDVERCKKVMRRLDYDESVYEYWRRTRGKQGGG